MSCNVTKFPGPALRLPKRNPVTDRFIEFYVPRSRAFLRCMMDLTKGVNMPHHHIRLLQGAKLDIMLWLRFLDFNG